MYVWQPGESLTLVQFVEKFPLSCDEMDSSGRPLLPCLQQFVEKGGQVLVRPGSVCVELWPLTEDARDTLELPELKAELQDVTLEQCVEEALRAK